MFKTILLPILFVSSLISIAQASGLCRKFNGIVKRNNCDCSDYLVNVRNILDYSKADYEEYCYQNFPGYKYSIYDVTAERCEFQVDSEPSPYYCDKSVGLKVHKKIVKCWRKNQYLGQNGVYMVKNGVCTLFCANGYYGSKCGDRRY